MNSSRILMNHGATAIGGVMGLDQLFDALDLLGEGGPLIKVGVLATKGIIVFLLGYFAFQPASIQTDVGATFTPGPKVVPVILLALLFGGCAHSQANLAKAHEVLVMVRADAKTAIVMGCADLPAAEVAFSVVQPFLPPDPTVSAVVLGVNTADAVAKAICAQVQASQPKPL